MGGRSPSLEVPKNSGDAALRDSGHGGGGLELNVGNLEVFSNLSDYKEVADHPEAHMAHNEELLALGNSSGTARPP